MARSNLQPQTDYTPGFVNSLGLSRERDPQQSVPSDPRVNMGNETRGGLIPQATSPTNASILSGAPKPKKYTDTIVQLTKK